MDLEPAPDLTPRTILVVDDDADIREMMVEILEGEGYVAHGAANGAAALELLRQIRPRLILVDLHMPVMSGVEFNEARLADPRWSAIPTVVMTAADRSKERVSSLSFTAHVCKPMDLATLLALAQRYVPL